MGQVPKTMKGVMVLIGFKSGHGHKKDPQARWEKKRADRVPNGLLSDILWPSGALICGGPVRPNMLNMPKSASGCVEPLMTIA